MQEFSVVWWSGYAQSQLLYMDVYPGPKPLYECVPGANSLIWMYTLYQLFFYGCIPCACSLILMRDVNQLADFDDTDLGDTFI